MKKWISLLLCILMMLTLLPAAIAEEQADGAEVTEPAAEPEETLEAEEPEEAPEAEEPEEAPEAEEPEETPEEPVMPEEPEETPEEPVMPEEPEETPEEPVAPEQPAAPGEPIVPGETDENPDAILVPIDEDIEAVVSINVKNFPDENFRNWVIQNLATGKTTMTQSQADAVDKIDCSGKSIGSLKGIAQFKNLKILCCNNNNITALDLQGNKKLEQLECKNNKLTTLNVSGCANLVKLDCTGNSIGTLSLISNKKLKELYASNNRLTKLITDNVTTLEVVYASNNSLSTIGNIKNNANLRMLSVNSNKLSTLELEKLTKLETLYAAGNKLSKLDLSKNPLLTDVNLKDNSLSTLDLTKNGNITSLDLTSNGLKKVDLTSCTLLQKAMLSDNGLTSLDLTKCGNLIELQCENNSLVTLDLSANKYIETLNLKSNKLGALDLSLNTELISLYVSNNKLCSLDVGGLGKMRNLNCANNRIYELDVSSCSALENLDCRNNQINTINLTSAAKLRKLYCQNNRLEKLDPSACTDLETLNCGNNFLRALHLTANTKLADVSIAPQTTTDRLNYNIVGGKYVFDMATSSTSFLPDTEKANIKAYSSAYTYDSGTGKMTMPSLVSEFPYYFNTGKGDMMVTVKRSFNANFTLQFASGAVEVKNGEKYVVYTGDEVRPDFIVKTDGGNTVDSYYYDYKYVNNVDPGTATLQVWMKGHATVKKLTFMIYLRGTEAMTIENVTGGIKLEWEPVDGAVGYVIYRRAWGSTTGGWTIFDRWNNTTSTTYTDTKVYAGTRYQYGVKAYYIDAYHGLGLVGVLKTTVRITTRTLLSATAGANQVTGKWGASYVFTGYQLEVATDSAFTKNLKAVKFADWEITKGTIKGLKADTTYYVRVRSYHEFEGMTYFGEWSNYKYCKTPK